MPEKRAYHECEVNTMGLMDMIQSLAGQTGAAAGTDQAKVAGGFIEALSQHPEGIQGVLDAFKNNGMASHIGAWGAGQAATATPEQVSRAWATPASSKRPQPRLACPPQSCRRRSPPSSRWSSSTLLPTDKPRPPAAWVPWPSSFSASSKLSRFPPNRPSLFGSVPDDAGATAYVPNNHDQPASQR